MNSHQIGSAPSPNLWFIRDWCSHCLVAWDSSDQGAGTRCRRWIRSNQPVDVGRRSPSVKSSRVESCLESPHWFCQYGRWKIAIHCSSSWGNWNVNGPIGFATFVAGAAGVDSADIWLILSSMLHRNRVRISCFHRTHPQHGQGSWRILEDSTSTPGTLKSRREFECRLMENGTGAGARGGVGNRLARRLPKHPERIPGILHDVTRDGATFSWALGCEQFAVAN